MSNSNQAFPFLSILALIFITLKLTGYITWSWWWVLAPLWGGAALLIAFFVLVFLTLFIKEMLK